MALSEIMTIIVRVLQIIFWVIMIGIAVQGFMMMTAIKDRVDNGEFPFKLDSLGIDPAKILGNIGGTSQSGVTNNGTNTEPGNQQSISIKDPSLLQKWQQLISAHDAQDNAGMVTALQDIQKLLQQKGATAGVQTTKDLIAAINAHDSAKTDMLAKQLEEQLAQF